LELPSVAGRPRRRLRLIARDQSFDLKRNFIRYDRCISRAISLSSNVALLKIGEDPVRKRLSGFGLRYLAVLACSAFFLLPDQAKAEDWPARPVHIVVPFAPGGATDILGRIFADKLSERLGQAVIVDNKPGAGGNIGAGFVARAEPDGYTLFVGSGPGLTSARALSKDADFDPVKDFMPITLLATQAFILAVDPKLPSRNIPEFVSYAKDHKGGLSYGTPGVGTPHHLAMELFKQVAGIDLVHVPYRGGGPMMQAALAGEVPVVFASYVIASPYLPTGKLRPIGFSARHRIPQAPDIIPIAEQGYPGFDVDSFFGLFGPAGTPQAITDRITREVRTILSLQDAKDRLENIGFETPPDLSTAEFGALVRQDVAKWTKVVTAAGIKPE
jgi:tripartite-type tricarboxylate transporter receptor subunit TctC